MLPQGIRGRGAAIARALGVLVVIGAGAHIYAQAPPAPPLVNITVEGRRVTMHLTPGGPTPAGFRIEAGSAAGQSDRAVLDVPYWTDAYTVEPVPAGQYVVRVRSWSAGMFSVPSNEEAVVVAGCPAPPAVPNFDVQVAGQRVALMITPDASGCAPTSYLLEAGTEAGATNILRATLTATVAVFEQVPFGTYHVRLKAVHEGGISAASPDHLLTVAPAGCLPPYELANLNATTIGNAATFRFAYGETTDRVFPTRHVLEAGSDQGEADVATLALPQDALFGHTVWGPPGAYWVRVRAYSACGTSVSDEVQVMLTSECVPPGRPVGPDAIRPLDALFVSWQAPASGGVAAEYRVDVGTSAGVVATRRVPARVRDPFMSTNFGALPPEPLFARVYASNVCGTSLPSVVVRAVGPACANPPAPGISSPEVSGSQVTIRWEGFSVPPVYASAIAIGTTEGGSEVLQSPPNIGAYSNPGFTTTLAPGRYFARVHRSQSTGCGEVWSNPSVEVSFEIPPS